MRSQFKSFCTAVSVLLLGACSNGNSSVLNGITNEFASLPEVTGPVESLAPASLRLGGIRRMAAATGVVLSSPGTFGAGTSVQMCENVNYLKEILREAASPDKILCYMSAMRSSGVIPSTANVADGNVKYLKLVNLPGGGGGGNSEPTVRVQIVKSAAGAVTSFRMQSCFNGSAASPEQSEYISQSFSGTTATVVSKYTGSSVNGAETHQYGSSMTATGSFLDGAWESKNISGYRYFGSSLGYSNVMTLDMDQYSNRVDTSIAMDGKYGSSSFTNKFYTVMEILGGDKLSTMAVGDGSSKVSMSYDADDDGTPEWTDNSTVSWAGDTKLNLGTPANGDHYTRANAGTVPSTPSQGAITFTGSEAWDCTVPAGETLIEADFTNGGAAIETGMQACEDKFLGSSDWLQCTY